MGFLRPEGRLFRLVYSIVHIYSYLLGFVLSANDASAPLTEMVLFLKTLLASIR